MPYAAPNVETIDTGIDYHFMGRGVAVMSDGKLLHMVQDRAENFQNLQWYRVNADGTGSTSVINKSISGSSQTRVPCSFVVDASDNIHCVYVLNDTTVMYSRWDLSGTYAEATDVTAFTVTGRAYYVDIAVLDSGAVCIAALRGSGTTSELVYCIRRTGGAMGSAVTKTLDNAYVFGTNTSYKYGYLSIAEDLAGATSNVQRVVFMLTPAAFTKHKIYGAEVNISTGAEVSFKTIETNGLSQQSTAYVKGQIFATASDQWTFGAVTGSGGSARGHAGRISWTGYTIPASMITLEPNVYNNSVDAVYNKSRDVSCLGDKIYIHVSYVLSSTYWGMTKCARISGNSFSWGNTKESAFLSGNVIRDMIAGASRNFSQKKVAYSLQSWNDGVTTCSRYLIINLPPGTGPTPTKPADGATVNSNFPTVGATVTLPPQSTLYKLSAKMATNVGMSANVKTFDFPDSMFRTSGQYSEYVTPSGSALNQQTWYVQLAYVDEYGVMGAYGAINDFTVAHPPSVSGLNPAAGLIQTRLTTPGNLFKWDFFDTSPDNTQTAYQIIIEENATGAAVADTGKVTSTVSEAQIVIPSGNIGDILRWKVRVWDNDDVASAYSGYSLCQFNNPPAVTIVTTSFTSPSPLIDWTVTNGTAGGQVAYRVIVVDGADSSTAYDSGVITSATTEHQIPNTVHPIIRTHTYGVAVLVYDAVGLQGGDIDTGIVATWTPPAQPSFSVDSSQYAATGAVVVTWTNAAQHANFVWYRVYRRVPGEDWVLVAHRTDVTATMTAVDIYASAQEQNDYIVTQARELGGVDIESDFTTIASTTPVTDGYHVTAPENQGLEYTDMIASGYLNFRIEHVKTDSFSDEREEAIINLVGKGRHRDVGTDFGVMGTITASLQGLGQVLSPRQERMLLEKLRAESVMCIFKNPFGDVWELVLGQLQFDRLAGVGTQEFNEVTIPYMEVSKSASDL